MKLPTWTPFGRRQELLKGREDDPFFALHREIDRLFDEFSRGAGLPNWPGVEGVFQPRIEVRDKDGQMEIAAELPGMEKNDIQVEIDDNLLTLRGEKKLEREGEKAGARFSEFRYGRFERTIPLPFTIEADKVAARYDKGVLTITVGKPAESIERRRQIQVEG